MIPNDRTFNGNYYFQEDGKTFYRYYKLEINGRYQLKLRYISKNSIYKQGIAIGFTTEPKFKGYLRINDVSIDVPRKKHFYHIISEEVFVNNELQIELYIKDGGIVFSSASNIFGDDIIEQISQMTGKNKAEIAKDVFTSGFSAVNRYGNAFWIEEISEKHYRFHCNDHEMDDDFDDFIFDVEIESFSKE